MTDEPEEIIKRETLGPTGFMARLRENHVDEEGFERLVTAIKRIAEEVSGSPMISRITVACLFEAPWEIENTVPHFSKRDPALGRRVSGMSNRLREAVDDLLWRGLEHVNES